MGSSREATAIWFPASRQVEFRREMLPAPGPGEVRIHTLLSALSQGTEMLVFRGQVPPSLPLDLPTLRGSFGFPIKYGYASVGRVVETGQAVESLRVGELVFVHHPHQTEYLVPASMPVALPPGMDPERGLFLANLETAVNVMLDAGIRLGERVVIFGQGVVGLLLTQLARGAGAGQVIAVDPIATRRNLALRVGASAALELDETLAERIARLTEGVGADVVLEASGNGQALDSAIEAAAFQGTVVVCSWYGTKPVSVHLGGPFHRRRLRLVSSQVGSIDPALQPRWNRERRLSLALEVASELKLKELITHRIPFSRGAEAYRLVDQQPQDTVQVILTYETNGT